MLLVDIGGRLLTALLAAIFAVLVVEWWRFRSGRRG
jgi:hypothetical protein